MTHNLTVELVTPEALLFSARAEMVVIPGVLGDFGVLPGHAPLVSAIRPGVIHIHETASIVREVFVAGGFAEVTGERAVILAEEAVEVHAINVEKATARLEKAQEKLKQSEHEKDKLLAEKEIGIVEAMLAVKA